MSRIEDQIKALLNGEVVEIKPQSRAEQYLQACINGTGVEGLPTPMSRLEVLLYQLAENPPGGSGGGSGGIGEPFLTFYDYDGTILHSYSEAEVAEMSELPPLPERDGLICQGWNYDLETIKSYNRPVNVGATYITDDGKTRLYITIAAEGRMDVPLQFWQSVANGVTIDWGDGSSTETVSTQGGSNTAHTYTAVGDYVISLDVAEGCTLRLGRGIIGANVLGADNAYGNMLKKVELGNGITSIGSKAFYCCYSLSSIVIPESVTSIGGNEFQYCNALTSIVIPDSVTSIGSDAFNGCTALTSIVIPESVTSISDYAFYCCYSLSSIVIPESVTSIGNCAFGNCNALTSIVIPESVTSIGDTTFQSCYSLSSIVIPESVTSIGSNAFYCCYSLSSIVIPESVASIGNYAFGHCNALTSIVIPESVTSIGNYAFSNCYSLSSIVIPDSVTSIGDTTFQSCRSLSSIVIPESVTSIGSNAFRHCNALASIVIPESVTDIGSSAFDNCKSVKFYDFTKHTSVPTLSNINAFSGIASDCEIWVPTALYDEWKSATNWSTYADKIIAK